MATHDTFPRQAWTFRGFPSLPMSQNSTNLCGRTLWAAFRASRALAKRLEVGGSVDATMFRLAIVDKVYEINSSEWPSRNHNGPKYTYQRQWMERIREIISEVMVLATRTLSARGIAIPADHGAEAFAEVALNRCWEPVVDSFCRGKVATYDKEVLGDFDPDKGDLTEDLRLHPSGGHWITVRAKMKYDYGTWQVLDYYYPPVPPLGKR